MRRRPEELATGEWAVLALVAEGPTHGYDVARALAPGGDVGRVWAMRRPLVYRTLDVLAGVELTRVAGTEPSDSGPQRTLIAATEGGARRVAAWLATPVEHVRDARSELMLKLLFLDRAGSDPAALLSAQHERLTRAGEASWRRRSSRPRGSAARWRSGAWRTPAPQSGSSRPWAADRFR